MEDEVSEFFVQEEYEKHTIIGFTEIVKVYESANSIVLKAKRDGMWYILKSLSVARRNVSLYESMTDKEFEITSQLDHPNIARVYGVEDVPGYGRCLVREYIDGVSLDEWLKSNPRLVERKKIATQLFSAMRYFHLRQIVHRDLKPANLIITRNGGNLKIIDFGFADADSYATLKMACGTRGYVSEEQANESVTDCDNDIYSLGHILSLLNLGIPLSRIAKRCTQPRGVRYPNIEALLSDFSRRTRRLRIIAASIAVFICALIGFGIYMVQEENGRPHYQEVAKFRVANAQYVSWGGLKSSVKLYDFSENSVVIPGTVENNGLTYSVEELTFDCLKNDTTLHNLVVQSEKFQVLRGAFKGCRNLQKIIMPSITQVPQIGSKQWPCKMDDIFEPYHYTQTEIIVPANLLEAFRNHPKWGKFKKIKPINKK